jgi:hypothetical protein
MLRPGLVLSLSLLVACSEDAEVAPASVTPVVDEAERPAAPTVETQSSVQTGTKIADQLLRTIPGEALLCAHLPDLGRAWSRLRGTVYGALVGGLDLVDVTLRLRPLYDHLRSSGVVPGTLPPPPWQDVERVIQSLNGEAVFSLLDLSGFDAQRPEIRALAGVSVHGAGEEAERLVDFFISLAGKQRGVLVKKVRKVWEIRSSDTPYAFEVGIDKDVVMFGIGEGTVAPALRRLRGKTNTFVMSSERCFQPSDAARYYVNVERMFERYSKDLPAPILQALTAIRLDRVRSLTGSIRIKDQNFLLSTFLDSPGGHDIFTRFLSANRVDYTLLEHIPKNLASFSLFTFNPSWILRNLRIGLPPAQAMILRKAIQKLADSGLDLSEKTLSTFGPQCAQIRLEDLSQKTTGPQAVLGSLKNSIWLIQIKNKSLVNRLIDEVSEFIPARRRYRIGRDEAITFNLGLPRMPGLDLDPSLAITPNYLYIALSEFSLRKALERGTTESARNYREQLVGVPDELSSVTFDDMRSPGMFGTAILTGMKTARAGSGTSNDPLMQKMSQLESAMSNLTPAVAYTVADETGVFSHTRSPSAGLSGIGGFTGAALIASIAIPNLLKAHTSANESAAIATLTSIRSAQEQFQLKVLRDADRDERGEYGFMHDLMNPERGDPLITKFPGANGRYMRLGYIFRVFLPGRNGKPIGESRKADHDVDPNFAERFVVVAAWPVEKGKTGRRAFILNTNGEIFFCADGTYGGRNQPKADVLSFEPGNLASRTLADGVVARDGLRWRRVR